MNLDTLTNQIYIVAFNEAKLQSHEYVTPEHFLYSMLLFDLSRDILKQSNVNVDVLINDLTVFLNKNVPKVKNAEPFESFSLLTLLNCSSEHAESCQKDKITIGDVIYSFFKLEESYALYFLLKDGIDKKEALKYISHGMKYPLNDDEYEENEKDDEYFLKLYTSDLTQKAKNGELDPLIGREDILERTIQVLSRRLKNNPVHIGEPGVGKTAIVEGIAQLIADKKVPEIIKNSHLYYLDMGSIIAGTKYRGEFEDRFIKILNIISKEKNPIIYIDEIHTIVGAGAVSGSAMDATSILKPYLLKSNIKIIGSTTYTEYKKYFSKDHALTRRFQKIDVKEPAVSDCIKILNGLKSKYEKYHNVAYTEKAIETACTLSNKYITQFRLPDKAIDIIDEAGAFKRMKGDNNKTLKINEDDIRLTISKIAGIPVEKISAKENELLKNLSINLKQKIFGQDNAVDTVVDAIKASRCGLNDSDKPVASLLFIGPTGVGKTEIAKQLSYNLNVPFVRFDMSEYQEKHSVSRLIGSPPGYVGYEEGGLLTEAINKTPYCVLLLDEIEKAHQDIFNILLQVMDYGKLTDNIGRSSDFRNVILIMTSNAGAKNINKHKIGFDDRILKNEAITDAIEKTFSPEFRNRLDETVIFNNIDEKMAILITKKVISEFESKLTEKKIKLKVDDNVYLYISKEAKIQEYGAREIKRVFEHKIKKKLIDDILFGKLSKGGTIYLSVLNDDISIKTRKLPVRK